MENTELPKPEETDSSKNNPEDLQSQAATSNSSQESSSDSLKSLAQNQEPMSLESSESAVQSATAPEKPDHSKFILFILLAVILGVVAASIASYVVLSNRKSSSQNPETVTEEAAESKETPQEEKTINSLTNESTSSNSNVQSIKLEDISFSIQNDWWSEEHTSGTMKWIILNPEPLPRPSDAIYAYSMFYSPNTSLLGELSSKKQNLENVVQENRNVNGNSVAYLSGIVKEGPLEGAVMEYAFMQKNGVLYFLEGTGSIEDSKLLFQEILDTVLFTN